MTEGVISSLIGLALLPQFRYAQQLPLRGSGFTLRVAVIRKLSYINNNLTAAASHRPTTSSFAPSFADYGQGRALSLRSVGIFINSYKINLTIPPPHVRSAPPFTQGRLKMRLFVNLNLIPQRIIYQNNVDSVLMARKSCYKELAANCVGRLAIKAGACF